MKKIKIIILTILLLIPSIINALEIDLQSDYAIIYNLDENKVIYEKNSESITSIASLTKIMTTIVSIEKIENLDEKVTITNAMLKGIPWDASVADLKVGQIVTYRDLLYASMLPSGADATQALAVSLTGSIDNFVEEMNKKANELKLINTHFKNTTGLDENGHYSTAKDILNLLIYSLQNETFKEIYTTRSYTTTYNETLESTMEYSNKRWGYNYNLSYVLGSKTGYTDEAGVCLSTLSNIDNTNLITVTINAPYEYGKSRNLEDINTIYNTLLEQYEKYDFIKEGDTLKTLETKYAKEETIDIISEVTISRYMEKPINEDLIKIKYKGENIIKNTTKKGTEIGTISIYYDNELIDEITAKTSINLTFSVWNYLKENIIYFIIILIILILTWKVIKKPKRRKRKY